MHKIKAWFYQVFTMFASWFTDTHPEQQYLNGLRYIMQSGEDVLGDRTGVGRKKVVGYQMKFDLTKGLPVLTTKKVFTDSVIKELLWFLKGSTNIEELVHNNVKIWNEWPCEKWLRETGVVIPFKKGTPEWQAEFNQHLKGFVARIGTDHEFAQQWGELGPVYGKQWRNFGETKNDDGSLRGDGIDQIAKAIDMIKNDPTSTRIIITGWNPKEVDNVALPPCHTTFHFIVINGKLHCHMWMRSADAFLGVPFNIASYAILTEMVAQVTGLDAAQLVISFTDFHVYLNQLAQVREQLSRTPGKLPRLVLNPDIADIFDFKLEDITIEGYQPQAAIKAPVAV